ncbi:DUF2089 domain-containing protein [Candidatus Binatus sp.]|uniref:DUF2089 domain-containing protein n=1 Tax=Candidatus Binatus sp. TaxID=2811406 RepID=UPI003C8117F8
MRPIILKCPSCDGNLTVARLDCPDCSISIEGEFAPPALLKLTGAQIDFIEVFIKNRGVIREVERELGVSYPTVRARLDEVIAALGYLAKSATDTSGADGSGSRRRSVLADLKDGKLTPDEALAALNEPRTKDS